MSLQSISPIDGRYAGKTAALQQYFSEQALMKYRVYTEIRYLCALLDVPCIKAKVGNIDKSGLMAITQITDDDAQIIKDIETKGWNGIPATNHDVKAVEYFIKSKFGENYKAITEYVHFGLTSEDINNISYGLMIRDAVNNVLLPELCQVYGRIYEMAMSSKDVPMLARTHGQPATPTTFGKEMLVFVGRMKQELKGLVNSEIQLKLNGATGNFNAHHFVFPDFDWTAFSHDFIGSLNDNIQPVSNEFTQNSAVKVVYNPITTQIEPHDSYLRVFDIFKRLNNILTDFSMDMWRYISDGWIKQKAVAGEIGSSAMPHKVNPIDFENAEGNFGVANALLNFFTGKLSISRLQRDLTDSTVERNFGTAFAHTLIAYKSLLKGLGKTEINAELIHQTLNNTPEVLAEAFQSQLRMSGVDKPYELLKSVTRGKKVTLESFTELAKSLNVSDEIKSKLISLTPDHYTGFASRITEEFDPKF